MTTYERITGWAPGASVVLVERDGTEYGAATVHPAPGPDWPVDQYARFASVEAYERECARRGEQPRYAQGA